MLCSVPASKSGSNWLDRLRSNKGLPTGDNLDLDHFLSRNTNSSSESPTPNVSSSTESTRPGSDRVVNQSTTSCPNRDNQGEAFIGLMNTVLSELFFMGGSDERSKLLGKKIPRKQANPRVCVASTTNSDSNAATANATEEKSSDWGRNDENVLDKAACLDSQNGSLMKNKDLGNVGGEEGEEVEEEEEEEKEDLRELKGYSISEVTVIDTSCGVWKTEKVVFRRKNVWKVREKKAKVRKFGRRKRKVVDEEVGVEGGDDIDKKKAKVSALKEADGDECIALKSTEGQNSQNDTSNEVCEDTPDSLNERGEEFGKGMPGAKSKDAKKGQVHLQVLSDFNILLLLVCNNNLFCSYRMSCRFPLSRSPRKMKKGDSSVILIKGIPTDNKNGGKLLRTCLKDIQKQYTA
ncbi:unnamed protein product [Prunus brigantina]